MLITSFYEIYGLTERISKYFEWFSALGNSGIPIIVFTDPLHVDLFINYPKTVKVIPQSLDTFELYKIGINYKGVLPNGVNKDKDTKEFLSLMNTKIEFIKNAMNHCEDETFVWVDFGILKIIKDKETVLDTLKKVNNMTFDKVIIPGCWTYGIIAFSVERIYWRFCGGFFVIPRNQVLQFYEQCKSVLYDFCTMPQYKLTWEVNVWTIVDYYHKHDIQWYHANHNDTIITNINTLICK